MDPDEPDVRIASLPDLPSVGYRVYEYADAGRPTEIVSAGVSGRSAELDNGLIRVTVDGSGVLSILDSGTGEELVAGANILNVALPAEMRPDEPVSAELEPLNLDYYETPVPARPREVCEGPVLAMVECEPTLAHHPEMRLNLRVSLVAGERQARVQLGLGFDEPTLLTVGGRGPHEGTYIPGLFVGFPFVGGVAPMADMAYCTTDGVLTSTNHETFTNLPFRNGTFNALSLAGPSTGEYAVLTRGLPDFFVTQPPSAPPNVEIDADTFLGLSLGIGTEGTRFAGQYVHEYAVLAPAEPDEAFMAARGYLVDAIAVRWKGGDGGLAREGSFIEATGDGVMVAGVQVIEDELSARVVNLRDAAVSTRLTCMRELDAATVAPDGELQAGTLRLGAKAVREIKAPL